MNHNCLWFMLLLFWGHDHSAAQTQDQEQKDGSLAQFVRDVQNTVYNGNGEIVIVRDLKDALRNQMIDKPEEIPVIKPPPVPESLQQEEPVSKIFVHALQEQYLQPIQNVRDYFGFSEHSNGPTPGGDIANKVSQLTDDFKNSFKYYMNRYAPAPAPSPKLEVNLQRDVLGISDDHPLEFVGPGQNPLLNPSMQNSLDDSFVNVQKENKLFPKFPALDEAVRYIDESFDAFGDQKKWKALLEKDRLAGPTLLEKVDNWMRPVHHFSGGNMIQSESTNPATNDMSGRLVKAANDAVASVDSTTTIEPTTIPLPKYPFIRPPNPTIPQPENWKFSETRLPPKLKTAEINIFDKMKDQIDVVGKISNQQYNIFSDPKYRPSGMGQFDLGDLPAKILQNTLGLRQPGESFEADVKKVLSTKTTVPMISTQDLAKPVSDRIQQMNPTIGQIKTVMANPATVGPAVLQKLDEAYKDHKKPPIDDKEKMPLTNIVENQLKQMSNDVSEQFPLITELNKKGFGQTILDAIDEQAREWAMLPQEVLQPTSPSIEYINRYATKMGYQPIVGPSPDPNTVKALQDAINSVGDPFGSETISQPETISDKPSKNSASTSKPVQQKSKEVNGDPFLALERKPPNDKGESGFW